MNASQKHRSPHLIVIAALTLVALACTCGSWSGLTPGAATASGIVTPETPPDAPIYDGGDGYQTSAVYTLEIGGIGSDTLDTLSEAHNWLFEGQEGQTVNITVSGQGISDPRARLLDPQGNVIAEDDDSGEGLDAFISHTLAESGLYTIRIDVFQVGPYSISLDAFGAADSGGEAGVLSYGETVSGQITSGDAADFWHFSGRQGDFVTITMQAAGSDLNGVVRLLDPTGAPLASGEGQTAQVECLLQSDGLYTIIASHADQSSGAYRLTLERGEIETLSYGGSAQGQISDSHFLDYYTFLGSGGDVVIITMVSTGGDLDSYLHLQGPDGLELAFDDDSAGFLDAQILRYVLPEQGIYTIIATRYGEQEGDSSGGYYLTLEQAEPLDLTPLGELEYGVEVFGTISDQDYEDRWTFEGRAGEEISLILEATSGSVLDPYLQILDSGGAELASNDDSGYSPNSRIEGFVLPADGTYTVVATRYGTVQGVSSGGYGLLLVQGLPEPPPPDGELSYGDTVEGEINDQNYQDRWVFQGAFGDLVTIRMERVDGELDSFLILLGPDNTEVAYDDDSGGDLNARIRGFMLPSSGSYTIVASRLGERSGTGAGRYTLTLAEEGPEDTTPNGSLQYGGGVSGAITDDNYSDYWAFQGTAGDLVAIAMQAEIEDGGDPYCCMTLDSYLRLLGPDGEEIAADDDTGGNLNSLILAALPETGTYTIGAQRLGGLSGYGEGAYTVTLDRITDAETLSIGQPVTGEITNAAPYVVWAFDGQAGDLVTITMEALDEMLDPYLTLLGPDGALLATDDDGGGNLNARIYQVLAESGRHLVIASRFAGEGRYELAVRSGQLQEQQNDLPGGEGGGSIQYGETLFGQITESHEADRWTFEGSEGDLITISMEGSSGSLDTFLVLLEPDGNEIGFNDDGGLRFNSVLYARLPKNGTYTIIASRYDGTGSYSLTLEKKAGTPISTGASQTGQIDGNNPFDFWTFDGSADMVVTITLEPATRQLEPELLLLGPGGQEIARSTEGETPAAIAAFNLPENGTYTIVASRSGGVQGDSEGGYRLRLEAD
jgi:hypothetical protein